MALLHVFVLAVVQGLTEFLPVSSSGHLVLVWEGVDYAGLEVPQESEQSRLLLDIAVHLGTLLAVCLYYYRDLGAMAGGFFALLTGRITPGARLAFLVAVASIPLGLVGYFFFGQIADYLHNIEVVAWTTIFFALVLYVTDRIGMTLRRIEHMSIWAAVLIGCCQVLALIPGTSRSGITMSAARLLGFERTEAARFSLLMAIPAIAGPGLLLGRKFYETPDLQFGAEVALAAGVSFIVAFATIALMIRWLQYAGFTPFVVYRLLLGAALLYWIA